MRTLSASAIMLVAGICCGADEGVPFSPIDVSGETQERISKTCISKICLGDNIESLDGRLSEVSVQQNKTKPEIYKIYYADCKRGFREHSGSEDVISYCKERAKESAEKYDQAISDARKGFPELITVWKASGNANEGKRIYSKHPELRFAYKYDGFGRASGIVHVEAKTQYGTYKDVLGAADTCQPIVVRGSVDAGNTIVLAVNEPKLKSFIVVFVATLYEEPAERQEYIINEYKERYRSSIAEYSGPYDNTLFSYRKVRVRETENGSLLAVYATHPAFRGWFSVEAWDAYPKGNVVFREDERTPDVRWRMFLKYPECNRIAERLSHTGIR